MPLSFRPGAQAAPATAVSHPRQSHTWLRGATTQPQMFLPGGLRGAVQERQSFELC